MNYRKHTDKYWTELVVDFHDSEFDKDLDPEPRFYFAWLVADRNLGSAACGILNLEGMPIVGTPERAWYDKVIENLQVRGWGKNANHYHKPRINVPEDKFDFETKCKEFLRAR